MSDMYRRREVLKLGSVAGLSTATGSAAEAKPIRIGLVGVGGSGTTHLRNLLRMEGVMIPAVGDINEERVSRAQGLVETAGQPKPEGYSLSETDFKRLCDRNDLDLVINATPWQWHVPISLAAMNAGKHTATEVPAAQTVEECME